LQSIKDINRGDLIHFVVNMADRTDKIGFYGMMGLAVLTGIITYYAFSAVSPAPGIVDSIYRQDLPPAPEATAADAAAAGGGGGGAAEEAIDESAFANKVEVKILAGSSTQGNPDYEPDAASATSDALVTWVNEDTVPHTATSGSGPQDPESATLFDTSIIMAGATASVPAEKMGAGDHPYYCTVHPFMQGTITVT
jgi:plastocyanin